MQIPAALRKLRRFIGGVSSEQPPNLCSGSTPDRNPLTRVSDTWILLFYFMQRQWRLNFPRE